jgi:hypothetical protein
LKINIFVIARRVFFPPKQSNDYVGDCFGPQRRFLLILIFLNLTLGACNLPASTPTPNLLATLSASTPLPADSNPQPTIPVSSNSEPTGKIAYTCQIFKAQASNQICIINADGTGFRRLTVDNTKQHYYPSVSPDGLSVVYAAFREPNIYEIYEVSIASGFITQLTNRLGNLNSPEFHQMETQVYLNFQHRVRINCG